MVVGVTKAGDDVVASVDGGCAVISAAPPVGTVYSACRNTELKPQVYEVPSTTTVRIRKEGNVLFNDALEHILFTVIWRLTYGKGPLR